jgi:pseudaminic acid biosynthesis-associated methylase
MNTSYPSKLKVMSEIQQQKFQTEQENFWAGEFGTNYISRNVGEELLGSNLGFFSHVLKSAQKIESCLELGANVGMNLKALRLLFPGMRQFGIEINPDAAEKLADIIGIQNVFGGSILEFSSLETFELVLIKGVLIHINPEMLRTVYQKLFDYTKKYILICEYYNPTPVEVNYRGHDGKLFKRDFAGEMLDAFNDLRLVDYGFFYHRDPVFPQDDMTWFLLQKG